ncbi:hypothetical protein WA026_004153 [Henosepilachna vigintioctopunctata]|uniref:Uncharacterized protein n=1 Tax=Henosepilachna vigintioctopunctata TaxID=420089 RepID=A0AAW1UE63_9CUCU
MNLKLLNISYNALSNIEDNIFTSLASLRILDLRRNLLEDSLHINDEVSNSLPDLRILNTDKSEDTANLYDNKVKRKKKNIQLGSNVKLNNIHLYESLNDENFTSNKDKRFIRVKRDESSNDSINKPERYYAKPSKSVRKLTGTIESLTEKLSGESQNIEKFSASINNISTHFIPDANNINFGGDEMVMHVNENTNTAPKKDQVVTPDLTKLEDYFHKFFDNFSSFLNRTEERDLKMLTEKHDKTDNKNQSLMDTFSKELFDEFAIEAKEMVAILSQLRLLVIFFGLVLLLLLTLKTFNKIKRLRNRGKHEYDGLSMEMPIINESQNSRF